MRGTAFIFIAAAAITGNTLFAQNVVYQQAGAIGVAGASGGSFFVSTPFEPIGARAVTGSPFSGSEERHTLQVLADGTRIERTDTSQISRDSEGRTRTESSAGPGGGVAMVTIQDPVAGVHYILNPAQKTASKIPLPPRVAAGNFGVVTGAMGARISASATADGPVMISASPIAVPAVPAVPMPPAMKAEDEDLGVQTVNGVAAKGTRSTINIPAGQIGNDRPIQVVSERWYSDELQMVVKSSNADPRFGTTTYELTNIDRTEPDASLFQVPADYTLRDSEVRTLTAPAK